MSEGSKLHKELEHAKRIVEHTIQMISRIEGDLNVRLNNLSKQLSLVINSAHGHSGHMDKDLSSLISTIVEAEKRVMKIHGLDGYADDRIEEMMHGFEALKSLLVHRSIESNDLNEQLRYIMQKYHLLVQHFHDMKDKLQQPL